MPEWVHDLSCWLLHQPHSAEWWAVVAVAAAIWGGLAAYEQLQLLKDQISSEKDSTKEQLELLRQQIAEARTSSERQLGEMETSRLDAQRPFVRLARAVRHADNVKLTFENIGPGPAIGIFVKAWFMGVDEEIQDNQALRRAHLRLQQIVESGKEQTADFNIGGMAPGARTKMPVGNVTLDASARAEAVGVFIEFEDVFGQRFPRAGDVGLQLGGVENKTMNVTFA